MGGSDTLLQDLCKSTSDRMPIAHFCKGGDTNKQIVQALSKSITSVYSCIWARRIVSISIL